MTVISECHLEAQNIGQLGVALSFALAALPMRARFVNSVLGLPGNFDSEDSTSVDAIHTILHSFPCICIHCACMSLDP